MAEILCPRCPMCGGPPAGGTLRLTWPNQAWCENPDCDAFLWDATKTLDFNIMNATAHRLPDWLGGDGGSNR